MRVVRATGWAKVYRCRIGYYSSLPGECRVTGGPTAERVVTIVNRRGLHARAAAKLVNLAEQFEAEVLVSHDDQSVSARSIMGLMMLGAGQNARVTLSGGGSDAADAVAAIEGLIVAGFHEDD